MYRWLLFTLLATWCHYTMAQEPFIEGDTLLFRLPSNIGEDSYSNATRYYRAQSSKRRGINYWTLSELTTPFRSANRLLYLNEDELSASIHAAYGEYLVGGTLRHVDNFDSGWNIESRFDFKTGRNASIDGLFTNRAQADISLKRIYGIGHHLHLNIDINYTQNSSQGATTQETFALTNNYLYNPAWGYYDGEPRSSRVNSYAEPHLEFSYQHPLRGERTLSLEGTLGIGETKRGSLGYYNAFNPSPDYYKNLPSAMDYGYLRDYVTAVWQSGDSRYTQIAWDELERYNLASPDGSAYYIVESRVERYVDSGFRGVIKSNPFKGVSIEWGVEAEVDNSLNYKELDDLLGADYHLDIDYTIGDNYTSSNQLQSNLRDPNRKVSEDESFGYNYSLRSVELSAVAAIRASLERFEINASARVGSSSILRTGHYESERFAGTLSYGESQRWSYSPIHLRAEMGYAIGAMHYLCARAIYMQSAPDSYDIFLNIDDANILSAATPLRSYDFSLSYRFSRLYFTLDATLFATLSRDGADITSCYDDLLGMMCRAQTTGIDSSSLGAEVTMNWSISRDWGWVTTLCAGGYRYTSSPQVNLYSDSNLSLVATSPSLVEGLIVGNAPQITATSAITYRGLRNYIINLNGSIAAMRYIEPSLLRRTQRIYNHTAGLSSDIVAYSEQELLDNIYDVELSIVRLFYLSNGDRITLRLVASNLLGDSDRVRWARESNRLTSYSVDGLALTWQGQASHYSYSAPRHLYATLTYKF